MADLDKDAETGDNVTKAEQRASAAGNVVRTNLGLLYSIVDEHKLDEDGYLSTSLSALRNRLTSNEIRLVVLGEFSSGKSTFVDTLLNTTVLATGILPTTAVCTSISFGPKPQCHVVLKNGSITRITPDEISAFSAGGSRSKEVVEIKLELPSSSLADGLTVIDTPGVNVNIAEHEAITSAAIETANACVYLMDARQPGKKTAIDFLRKIRSKVDKFFFLLNRADILDSNEQEEALDYVKDALNHECGIQNPRVELISSLPSVGIPWTGRFEAFKERLQDFMVSERDAVICAELARLLDHAIVRSEYLLESKFRLAEQELAEHYKTSIPDGEQIASSLKRQIDSLVAGDSRRAQSRFSDFHKSVCTDLRKSVDQCISTPFIVETLVTVVPKQISCIFDTHAAQLDQFVGGQLRTIFTVRQEQVTAAIRRMFYHVRWLEQRAFFSRPGIWLSVGMGVLLLLGGEYILGAPHGCITLSPFLGAAVGSLVYETFYWARNQSLFSPGSLPNPAYSGYVQSAISEGTLFQRAASAPPIEANIAPMQIGRVAGALAGNPWLVVVGGAISGTLYGVKHYWDKVSGKLEKLRAEIRNNVKPILDEFDSGTKSGGINAIQSGRDTTLSTLHEVVDKAIQRYSAILDRLVKPHRRMRRMLEVRHDRLHDDAIRLRTSREVVVDSLQRLEKELKGAFSYYPKPQWPELEKSAGHRGVGSSEDSVIPILPQDVVDFCSNEAESSSFHRGAVAGNAISSTTRQPLVLGWVVCLLVSIGLTVASLKVAGAIPFLASSGEESKASISSTSNDGSDRTTPSGQATTPSEQTANQDVKPSALGAVVSDNSPPSQAEPQDTSDVVAPSPGSQSATNLSDTHPDAVQQIRSLLDQWVDSFKEKDLQRQVDCYAPQLDIYYRKQNAPQAYIQDNKSRAFSAIAEIRQFEISNVNISVGDPQNGAVTFDKTWDTTLTSGKRYTGSEMERLKVSIVAGSWRITSEEEVKIYYVVR